MMERLFDSTAEGWIAAATVIYTLVTTVLAAAAILAWKSSHTEVRELRRTRQDSLRPVVVVDRISMESIVDTYYLQVHVRNIGLGPAMEFEVDCWIIPEADPEAPVRLAEMTTFMADVLNRTRDGQAASGRPFAPGEEATAPVTRPGTSNVVFVEPGELHVFTRVLYVGLEDGDWFATPDTSTEHHIVLPPLGYRPVVIA